MKGFKRITKVQFYNRGAWANRNLTRKADSLGRWIHFERW